MCINSLPVISNYYYIQATSFTGTHVTAGKWLYLIIHRHTAYSIVSNRLTFVCIGLRLRTNVIETFVYTLKQRLCKYLRKRLRNVKRTFFSNENQRLSMSQITIVMIIIIISSKTIKLVSQPKVQESCVFSQWRSKALRGPGSTVTWEPTQLLRPSPKCWEWGGALGRPAVGERCKLPSGVSSRQEFWCF